MFVPRNDGGRRGDGLEPVNHLVHSRHPTVDDQVNLVHLRLHGHRIGRPATGEVDSDGGADDALPRSVRDDLLHFFLVVVVAAVLGDVAVVRRAAAVDDDLLGRLQATFLRRRNDVNVAGPVLELFLLGQVDVGEASAPHDKDGVVFGRGVALILSRLGSGSASGFPDRLLERAGDQLRLDPLVLNLDDDVVLLFPLARLLRLFLINLVLLFLLLTSGRVFVFRSRRLGGLGLDGSRGHGRDVFDGLQG